MNKFLLISIASLFAFPFSAFAKGSQPDAGRFQIMQLNDMARSQYMIDTQTGKIWNRQCGSYKGNDCSYNTWVAEDVEGITITHEKMLNKAVIWDKINNPPAEDQKK